MILLSVTDLSQRTRKPFSRRPTARPLMIINTPMLYWARQVCVGQEIFEGSFMHHFTFWTLIISRINSICPLCTTPLKCKNASPLLFVVSFPTRPLSPPYLSHEALGLGDYTTMPLVVGGLVLPHRSFKRGGGQFFLAGPSWGGGGALFHYVTRCGLFHVWKHAKVMCARSREKINSSRYVLVQE